jgi:spore germination cell wall hydrolase CwlJ-like protein
MITTTLLCLTLNIYHESRGESIETQEAVATITLNRSKKLGKGVCKVVYTPSAFSWTRHGSMKIRDKVAFERAKRVAEGCLRGRVNGKVGDRLYFNEKRLGKRFKTKHKPIVIGKLIMY